jgi:hypothetical protein
LGLRKNKDLDVWATENIIKKIAKDKNFIHKASKLDGTPLYETHDGSIEIASTLPPFKDIKEHLKRSIFFYGIHFQSPKDVLEWKKYMNRSKDQEDIKLLTDYLKKNVVENYLNIIQLLK